MYKKFHLIYILGAIVVATAEWGTTQRIFGQTNAYVVRDLSRDDSSEVPAKLNNLGDIAGRAVIAGEGGTRATTWKHSGVKSKHLGVLLGGDYSSAAGINDAGQVVGASNTSEAILPFLWTATGGLKRVPLLSGDSCGQATGINKQGDIAGYSSGPNGVRAFLWTRKAGVRDLGVLAGGDYSRARDLNDLDDVVGTSASSAGERAVLWTKAGSICDLGTLPGDWASEATAINNAGSVVGSSKGPAGVRAFIWSKESGMQALGVLPGGASSRALDISDLGEVVGSSTSASGEHAFVWTRQTGMTDLNGADALNLGVVFVEAHAINSKGEILVMGRSAEEGDMNSATASTAGQHCAPAPPSTFLLTPVSAK
jgi:probable HAF family extracellular repeat protein